MCNRGFIFVDETLVGNISRKNANDYKLSSTGTSITLEEKMFFLVQNS